MVLTISEGYSCLDSQSNDATVALQKIPDRCNDNCVVRLGVHIVSSTTGNAQEFQSRATIC